MPSTSRPWASPLQVGWCAISEVHWVIARTKTRSKKSSSGVTRSPSRSTALRREERLSAVAIESSSQASHRIRADERRQAARGAPGGEDDSGGLAPAPAAAL